MKTLFALALLLCATAFAKDYTVTLTYGYGSDGDGFHVTEPSYAGFNLPTDRIVYRNGGDTGGTLVLQLDNGRQYISSDGEIALDSTQLSETHMVRCSMITPDGEIVGWETDKTNKEFGSVPDTNSPAASSSWLAVVAALLAVL